MVRHHAARGATNDENEVRASLRRLLRIFWSVEARQQPLLAAPAKPLPKKPSSPHAAASTVLRCVHANWANACARGAEE
jgi:hypothetical protein